MEKLNHLIAIAKELDLVDTLVELTYIQDRFNQENKEVKIPIIGEFSSGKTSLINALTDNKKLETASKATTATIYEVYFGQEKILAQVYDNGNMREVTDISSLKNSEFENTELIKIFDTSTKIPTETILIDTPGLSSNDPRHIEALSRYLPYADALFLCVDANQQVTKTLLDFLKINKLAHLPLYLIITKTDTKTPDGIKSIKKYISENIELSPKNIIGISTNKNDLSEFFTLIDKIQKEKNEIIANVLNFRIEGIAQYLKTYIDDLIKKSSSDKQLEREINEAKYKLEKLHNAIEMLVDDLHFQLIDVSDTTIRDFEYTVSERLDSVVAQRDANVDGKAIGLINATSNVVLGNYQQEVQRKLYEVAQNRRNTELEVSLRSLENINISELRVGELSYGINLASAGESTVKGIAMGVKIAAAAAAVAVVVSTAGAAGAAAAGGKLIDAADTATDVISIHSNMQTQKKVKELSQMEQLKNTKWGKLGQNTLEMHTEIEKMNLQNGGLIAPGSQGGFVENFIGGVFDGSIGKPQRKRMIQEYLDSSLIPEFRNKLQGLTNNLLSNIKQNLDVEANLTINQLENNLNELKNLHQTQKEEFEAKIKLLKNHLQFLNK